MFDCAVSSKFCEVKGSDWVNTKVVSGWLKIVSLFECMFSSKDGEVAGIDVMNGVDERELEYGVVSPEACCISASKITSLIFFSVMSRRFLGRFFSFVAQVLQS